MAQEQALGHALEQAGRHADLAQVDVGDAPFEAEAPGALVVGLARVRRPRRPVAAGGRAL